MQSVANICREYLAAAIKPSTLGISNIFLGGSIVQQDNLDENATKGLDWDGVAFVGSRASAIDLITKRRAELCRLFKIEEEEGNDDSWRNAIAVASEEEWQVIRFSGWTRHGSKRTVKIWNLEDFGKIIHAQSVANFLGVLSHKTITTIQCNDSCGDPSLALVPAKIVSTECFVMQDYDFISVSGLTPHGHQKSWPGLIFDLLLTSQWLFEISEGSSRRLVTAILVRWIALNSHFSTENLVHLLHGWTRFTESRRQMTRSLYRSLLNGTDIARCYKSGISRDYVASPIPFTLQHHGLSSTDDRFKYHTLIYLPQIAGKNEVGAAAGTWRTTLLESDPTECNVPSIEAFRTEAFKSVSSFFSRNSKCGRMSLIRKFDGQGFEVFVKTSSTFNQEMTGLDMLSHFFPSYKLQKVIARDDSNATVYYQYFPGQSLLEIRFQAMAQISDSSQGSLRGSDFVRWLISVELVRAQDVLSLYQRTIVLTGSSKSPMLDNRPIHKYFSARLENNQRLQEFYGHVVPSFLRISGDQNLSLASFLRVPITINGRYYGTLQRYLSTAEQKLDPACLTLQRSPHSLGFGDGHGGNVLVMEDQSRSTNPEIRYIDYEAVGFHSPVLDLAKPVYLDCFCRILWADLLSEDLSRVSTERVPHVQWQLKEHSLDIQYNVSFSFLDRALAAAKFEYLVRPTIHMCIARTSGSMTPNEYEDLLSQALLACAVLTRDFPEREDVFFLNLAVGLELVTDLKGTVDRFFGWNRWIE